MDTHLNPEELNKALMGATITGFRALLNGRDVLLETTAGSVLMTNELKYTFISPANSHAEMRNLEKSIGVASESAPHTGDVGFSC